MLAKFTRSICRARRLRPRWPNRTIRIGFWVIGFLHFVGCRSERPSQDVNALSEQPTPDASLTTANGYPLMVELSDGASPFSAEPELEIGDAIPLFNVRGATRLSDGTTVVADGGSQQLLYIAGSGEVIRTEGGKGQGPGEFKQLGRIHSYRGDSLVVFDYTGRRISVFDSKGRFGRSVYLEAPPTVPLPVYVAPFADGDLLISEGDFVAAPEAGLYRKSVRLYLYDALGSTQRTLSSIRGIQAFRGSGSYSWAAPFGRRTLLAVADSVYYVLDTDSTRLVGYSKDGARIREILLPSITRAVEETDIEAFRARYRERIAKNPNATTRRVQEDFLAEVPFPETFPSFRTLLADPYGRLWIEDAGGRSGMRGTWTVVRLDGSVVNRVRLPPGLDAIEIGRDYVLGLWTGELGTEYVRLHRLER